MATKTNNKYIQKATNDEELFILMGRDSTAPEVVLEWIKLNFRKQPEEKLREAFETAINLARSEAKHIVAQKALDGRGAFKDIDFRIPTGTKIESRKDGAWIVRVESSDHDKIRMKAFEHQDSEPLRLTLPYPMYPMHGQEIVIVASYNDEKVKIWNAERYDAEHPF